MARAAYMRSNRLEDVIFLIQHLGLGPYSITDGAAALGASRRPANRWSEIGDDHPEFFRLTEDRSCVLSLRYHLRQGAGNPPPLPLVTVQQLVQNAMALQERQAKRVDVWKSWVTMSAAVAAAFSGIAGLFGK